jgi:endonuclease-3 related protein
MQVVGFPAGTLRQVHDHLLSAYGAQHWWPADSRFEVMVGAILTQNTAWSNVEKAIVNLRAEGMLSAQALLGATVQHLGEVIRSAGYFNLKARRLQAFCRFYLQAGEATLEGLSTAALRQQLLQVKGVGPETADDILLYAFERPVFVIEAYSRRLFSRLGLCRGDEAYDALRLGVEKALSADQALYNAYHALIVRHAKRHCRKTPRCDGCVLAHCCPACQATT